MCFAYAFLRSNNYWLRLHEKWVGSDSKNQAHFK